MQTNPPNILSALKEIIVTYGEFLRWCRTKAGYETKTDFARKLSMLDGDHYTGAENDKANRKPSLDLMERAARLAGLEFQDFIQAPAAGEHTPRSREREKLHRQLDELLDFKDDDGEVSAWFRVSIQTFYRDYFAGKRARKR
jgi:transcriptional regulator with XRE-family HTH domain